MCWIQIIWDLPDDPDGNVPHIEEHGLSREEVEDVLLNRSNPVVGSRTSDNLVTFGRTSTGIDICVVWEHVMDDPLTMRPITAYKPED